MRTRILVRPNIPVHVIAFAVCLLGPLLAVVGLALHLWTLVMAAGAMMVFGRLPWIFVRERNVLATRSTAEIEVNGDEVRVDGKRVLATSEIEQAFVMPNEGDRTTVRVHRNGRWLPALEIEIDDAADGETFLREIGFAADQKPARFRTLDPRMMRLAPILIGLPIIPIFLLKHAGTDVMLAASSIALAIGMMVARLPRWITVKPDGVEATLLGRYRQWFPFEDVEKAQFALQNGTLTLKNKKTLTFRASGISAPLARGQRSSDQVVERAMEAFEAHVSSTAPSHSQRAREIAVAAEHESKLPDRVMVLRTNWPAWAGVFGVWIAAFVLMFAGHGHKFLTTIGLATMFAGVAAQFFVLLRLQMRRFIEAPRVETDGLSFGRWHVSRSQVENAYLKPRVTAQGSLVTRELKLPRVIFTGKNKRDSLSVAVDTETEGRALLKAFALDPKTTVSTFRVRGGIIASSAAQLIFYMLLIGGANLFHVVHGPWRIALGAAILLAFVNALWPKTVRIGNDGVFITSIKKRYFPFSSLAAVETSTGGLALRLKNGERVDIRTMTGQATASQERDAIIELLQHGIARASGAPALAAIALERGELTPREWLDRLRAIGKGQTGAYREAAIEPADLWRVLEDPTAKAPLRVAAAAALRVDVPARDRLRVAAASLASPDLREAFEAAADDDDGKIEAALTKTSGAIE